MKIIVADLMNPRGHKAINEFYLQLIRDVDSEFITFFSSSSNLSNGSFNFEYEDEYLKYNRVLSAIGSLITVFKLFKIVRNKRLKMIVLMSYDITSLPIISFLNKFFFRDVKVLTFEHNTAPVKKKSIKSTLHKISGDKLIKLCYSNSLTKLYRDFSCKAIHVHHPILTLKKAVNQNNQLNENYVFCPSGSSDLKCIREAPVLFNRPIVFKSKIKIAGVDTVPYFDDYYDVLSKCKLVYLPVTLHNRVSGPFFEALYYNKLIVVERNNFGFFAKDVASNNVIFSDEIKKADEYLAKLKFKKFDCYKHNQFIIKKLRVIFNAV